MIRIISLILLLTSFITNAQTDIIVQGHIKMPKDTLISNQLIKDLNGFLSASENENNLNKYVLNTQKIETYILVDEFKKATVSRAFKDKSFFKPYLTNVVALPKDKYALKISHIGVFDSIPYLRTVYNLTANKTMNGFRFSSPLIENTANWKKKTIKNVTFYFKDKLHLKNAKNYVKLANFYDAKLKLKNKKAVIYCAKNRNELLKIIGVDYKLDYNGRTSGVFNAIDGDKQIIVLGKENNSFDPHDLWHDRLSMVISRREVNKPIDEAIAYLYGGSWGLSWQQIFNQFKETVANDKTVDWKAIKENRLNFATTQREHLIADYVVNALLVDKIEKEKGFDSVWKFLNCGKFEKGNTNYYKVLFEITGINQENYNKAIWKLIKNYKP